MGTILVTGGAGYVGSVCCEQLVEHGHDVIVIDDLSTGHAGAVPAQASLRRMSYGDRAAVAGLLKGRSIDAVFHFAAKALIPESVSNPGTFFSENVAAGITFLETLRASGARRFIFSSSAAVYGSPTRIPVQEEDPTNPVNSYGETKLMFERVLRWYAEAYGWSVVAFRYFNASGATERAGENHRPETHIIPLLLTAAGEGSCFNIFGDNYETPDGTCLRDYVHVSDIAAAHLLALTIPQEPGMKIYNIGSGRPCSVREVICAVEEVTSRKVSIRISGRRPGDPAVLCASPVKIERELGWRPMRSELRQIIRSAWEWHTRQLPRQAA